MGKVINKMCRKVADLLLLNEYRQAQKKTERKNSTTNSFVICQW